MKHLLLLTLFLAGCATTSQNRMFYQAYEVGKDSSAPFFLTIKEAQGYCDRMNKDTGNNYQVGIIAQ